LRLSSEGYEDLHKELASGRPLPSRVPNNPRVSSSNGMKGKFKFLWWDYRSMYPPSIPKRASRVLGRMGRSSGN
jgi:hypothetical protein